MITLPALDYGASSNIGGFSIDSDIRAKLNAVSVVDAPGNEVRISRLDNLKLPKSPCLIKIDVEGLEQQVLTGGTRFLREHGFPPIFLEAWHFEWFRDRRSALLNYVRDLGYALFEIADEVIAQHPAFGRLVEFRIEDGMIRMLRTK